MPKIVRRGTRTGQFGRGEKEKRPQRPRNARRRGMSCSVATKGKIKWKLRNGGSEGFSCRKNAASMCRGGGRNKKRRKNGSPEGEEGGERSYIEEGQQDGAFPGEGGRRSDDGLFALTESEKGGTVQRARARRGVKKNGEESRGP